MRALYFLGSIWICFVLHSSLEGEYDIPVTKPFSKTLTMYWGFRTGCKFMGIQGGEIDACFRVSRQRVMERKAGEEG